MKLYRFMVTASGTMDSSGTTLPPMSSCSCRFAPATVIGRPLTRSCPPETSILRVLTCREQNKENGLILLRDVQEARARLASCMAAWTALRGACCPCSETVRRTQEQHGPASRDETTAALLLDRFLSNPVYGTASPALSKRHAEPHHA